MDHISKKAKITGHFRVALRPQDVNVERPTKKVKKLQDIGKENFHEVITIDDDEDDNLKVNNNNQNQSQIQNVTTITAATSSTIKSSERQSKKTIPHNEYLGPPGIHANIVDHDRFMLFDFRAEPHYAWDSFKYDREQEIRFRSRNYIDDEKLNHQITPRIRARLVDWLVHIQDYYALYHESLYMAVKIADQYLMQKTVPKRHLQLLYMTSILISSKFEERQTPVDITSLIHETGGVYSRKQVICFEVDILSTLGFNIRFPLSFGFLRRYARCTRSDQKTLTLARYILESSLLDYEMIEVIESKIAAASLLLSFEILHLNEAWSETAEFYTGYSQGDLYPLLPKLNDLISKPTKDISKIREKYSDENYMFVAKLPPLPKNWEPLTPILNL